jgi:hypothetical protein
MNNFFKMSLVAAAIAVSSTATAGVVVPAAGVYSAEGIAITTATAQLGGGFVYTTATDYEAGAVITFTYSAGAIASSTVFPAAIDSAIAAGVGTMTLTKSSQTADSVSYTVTAKQGTGTVLGNTITMPASTSLTIVDGVLLNTAAIKAGPVTVKASAQYQGVAFDPDTTTATVPKANYLASTATQFGTFAFAAPLTDKFDAIIDSTTGSLGKVFAPVAPDIMTVTYTPVDVSAMLAVIGTGGVADTVNNLSTKTLTSKVSVAGKFTDFAASQIAGGTVALTSTGFDLSAPAAVGSPLTVVATVTPDATKNSALVIQDFNVTPMISYTGGSKTYDAIGAGNWSVSSEMATVTYMPYGDGVSQIIYLTNTSDSAAKVAVTATDENGVKYALGTLVTAAGNGKITKITEQVRAALLAQGFSKGKVALDFMFVGVTAGATPNVKVYSAYNVNGTDRGFVANTTNGAK